jgi:hypothetical protein
MAAAIEVAKKRAAALKEEMSGDNFSSNGVYGFNADVNPYVSSVAPLPTGDLLSPKAQDGNVESGLVTILKGQDNSVFLPKTTGTDVAVTYENGRPNISISIPSISYTEIANSFIQAIIKGEKPSLPTNIRTTISITPPRDSSGDRSAASVVSPLSNATSNTITTTTEAGKIQL